LEAALREFLSGATDIQLFLRWDCLNMPEPAAACAEINPGHENRGDTS
jgi:hypothetical protein